MEGLQHGSLASFLPSSVPRDCRARSPHQASARQCAPWTPCLCCRCTWRASSQSWSWCEPPSTEWRFWGGHWGRGCRATWSRPLSSSSRERWKGRGWRPVFGWRRRQLLKTPHHWLQLLLLKSSHLFGMKPHRRLLAHQFSCNFSRRSGPPLNLSFFQTRWSLP